MSMGKIRHLYETIKQSDSMKRKVLLVANFAQGHLWLEQACRTYGTVLNTEVHTLEDWVLKRCKLLLARNKLRYVTASELKWIVCDLLRKMTETDIGGSYLSGVALTPGLVNTFHSALTDLREAGVRAEQLQVDHFERRTKGIFVKSLLVAYEERLKQAQLVDLAELLLYAQKLPAVADIVIVDEYAIKSAVERSLLQACTSGVYTMLCAEKGFIEGNSPFPAANAQFFRAMGSLAETREVVRRIVEEGISFDQVEIVASDYDKTASAIYTVTTGASIPCTFAEGLPIGTTRSGKAAKLYLEWLESGYRLDIIVNGLKQGVIRFVDDEFPDAPTEQVVRALERSGIGWGKERYSRLLGRLTDEEIPRMLRRVFSRIFQPLTDQTLASPGKLVRAITEFVETYALILDKNEIQVMNSLRNLELSMGEVSDSMVLEGSLAIRFVRECLEGLRVAVTAIPLPGRLHVTSLASGGQTGRPQTFIMGMSENNWAHNYRQDPVLLDEERTRISPQLLLSTEEAKRRIDDRNRRIGMIRGRCVLSCSTYDLSDHGVNLPAYEMLQVLRRKIGMMDADYEALLQAMGAQVRFFQSRQGNEIAPDAVEIWLSGLLPDHSRLLSAQRALHAIYPSIKDGEEAKRARLSHELTPYDGIVKTSTRELPCPDGSEVARVSGNDGDNGQPEVAFSASDLELYATCPLQYFFKEVLGVRVKPTTKYDRTKWLDAIQRGSLLHQIFNRYLAMSEGRGKERLLGITEYFIREYADRVPTPNEHIFHKEVDSIRADVEAFYASERQRPSTTVHTELRLHRKEEPFLLELSEELSLPIRGFVDRVDEISPHRYKIYDYKTGNPRSYSQNDYFSKGTQLQLAIYGLAVEQWMRKSGYDEHAEVIQSAYLFPTERGMGEEVERPQNRRDDLAALMRTLIEAMENGLYPPTDDPRQCGWCDYKAVCGTHAEQFKLKRNVSENAEKLLPLLEVSRYV